MVLTDSVVDLVQPGSGNATTERFIICAKHHFQELFDVPCHPLPRSGQRFACRQSSRIFRKVATTYSKTAEYRASVDLPDQLDRLRSKQSLDSGLCRASSDFDGKVSTGDRRGCNFRAKNIFQSVLAIGPFVYKLRPAAFGQARRMADRMTADYMASLMQLPQVIRV